MYKTVVVPVDLSHLERLEKMTSVAKEMLAPDGKMIAVHVSADLPIQLASEFPAERLHEMRKQAKQTLKEEMAKIGIDCEVEERVGQPATEILQCAEDNKADLIVIASHKPGLQDYFLGSTAGRVVRHAKCCVHVIR